MRTARETSPAALEYQIAAERRGQTEDRIEECNAVEKGASDRHRSGPGAEKRNDLSACRDHEAR